MLQKRTGLGLAQDSTSVFDSQRKFAPP